MSAEGPKNYPVVYDANNGLQYSFQTGYETIDIPQGFPSVDTDPAAPVEGQVWYNTTDHVWKGYNGTDVGSFDFTPDA